MLTTTSKWTTGVDRSLDRSSGNDPETQNSFPMDWSSFYYVGHVLVETKHSVFHKTQNLFELQHCYFACFFQNGSEIPLVAKFTPQGSAT